MKLFSIYYMNVMQEPDREVMASEEHPTREEALAYLIKNELVGEYYSDDIEVHPCMVEGKHIEAAAQVVYLIGIIVIVLMMIRLIDLYL